MILYDFALIRSTFSFPSANFTIDMAFYIGVSDDIHMMMKGVACSLSLDLVRFLISFGGG